MMTNRCGLPTASNGVSMRFTSMRRGMMILRICKGTMAEAQRCHRTTCTNSGETLETPQNIGNATKLSVRVTLRKCERTVAISSCTEEYAAKPTWLNICDV